MARAPHPARDQAISDIKNLVAFHGDQAEGERAARAKWADIPATTFEGGCQLARRPAEPASVRPPSVRACAAPVADGEPMTFEERIAAIDENVALVLEASTRETIDPETGEVRRVARNPAMIAQAARLQLAAAEVLVKNQMASWKAEAVEAYHEEVMEAIEAVRGAADRELAERVIAALRAIEKRWTPSRDNVMASTRAEAA
jgi:hypothetical protein